MISLHFMSFSWFMPNVCDFLVIRMSDLTWYYCILWCILSTWSGKILAWWMIEIAQDLKSFSWFMPSVCNFLVIVIRMSDLTWYSCILWCVKIDIPFIFFARHHRNQNIHHFCVPAYCIMVITEFNICCKLERTSLIFTVLCLKWIAEPFLLIYAKTL